MKRMVGKSALVFIFFISACFECMAQDAAKEIHASRFASLRSSEANLRTGPGMRYPIEWIYKKRDLPVEITEEHDVWRKIRDMEGTTGWIHQSMLSSRRYGVIMSQAELRRSINEESPIVANIEGGVIVKLISCSKNTDRCRVEVKGKHGFVKRSVIWGIHPDENL